MSRRFAAVCFAGLVVWLLMPDGVAGQASRPASHVPRTPWGAPDLTGTWTGSTLTPLERPAEFADKPVLTVEEAAALEARARARNAREPQAGPGDPGTYNQIWFDPSSAVVPDRRSSLIVDPPDGRLPFTPEGRAHDRKSSGHYGTGPRDGPEDLDTGERCLTDGVPIPVLDRLQQQLPDRADAAARDDPSEMYHNVRVIPLDGRARTNDPAVDRRAARPLGWRHAGRRDEGFADKSAYWWATGWRASRPTLRLIERFTRVDRETLDYEFTMIDPATFTRPWTARFPLTTNQASRGVTEGPMYQDACHEGNYSLPNVAARREAAGRAMK